MPDESRRGLPSSRGSLADAMAAAMERAPIMIAMLIVFTIGGQNFERHEPMPNLATCWQRAPERMNALLAAHPEITQTPVLI
jgi:hypothetical protein